MENKIKISVNREGFLRNVLIPVSKFSSSAVIVCEGNLLYAISNLSSDTTGQMFLMSDINIGEPVPEKITMVISNITKLITAFRVIPDEVVDLYYDVAGLEYSGCGIAFRVRLSGEEPIIPFKREKVLALPILYTFSISKEGIKTLSTMLSGFPNLNQILFSVDADGFVCATNSDRGMTTDEKVSVRISDFVSDHSTGNKVTSSDEFPEISIFNYVFRTNQLSFFESVIVEIGKTSITVVCKSENGFIRYILPSLKKR